MIMKEEVNAMSFTHNEQKNLSTGIFNLILIYLFISAYKTVSGVNGPLVILDDVKVRNFVFEQDIFYFGVVVFLFIKLFSGDEWYLALKMSHFCSWFYQLASFDMASF